MSFRSLPDEVRVNGSRRTTILAHSKKNRETWRWEEPRRNEDPVHGSTGILPVSRSGVSILAKGPLFLSDEEGKIRTYSGNSFSFRKGLRGGDSFTRDCRVTSLD